MTDEQKDATDVTDDTQGHGQKDERPEAGDREATELADDDVEGHVLIEKFPSIEGRGDAEPR